MKQALCYVPLLREKVMWQLTQIRSVSKYLLWGTALDVCELVSISSQRDGLKTRAGRRIFVVSLPDETTLHTCSKRRDTNTLWQTVRNPEEFNTGGSGQTGVCKTHTHAHRHTPLCMSVFFQERMQCVPVMSQRAPGCSHGIEKQND